MKVEPSPFSKVRVFKLTEPVIIKEPVSVVTALPVSTVRLNIEPSLLVKVRILSTTEPVTIKIPEVPLPRLITEG